MSPAPPPSPRDSFVGRLVDGRYRILEHLADGGMASVWRAVDERLEREVAVKVLRRGLAEDHVLAARFRHEALAAARLNDPRIVAVYDQGTDRTADAEDMFLVMELVPGQTLRELVHYEAPLQAHVALDLLEPICEALAAAHAAGIVHGDVKPENVLIRPDGQVKVADFGLARAVTGTTSTRTAASGALLGTVSYLSPEQVEHGRGDRRSDVYAVGIMTFELLTGRKPFVGESPIHVAYQHVHGVVPAPSSLEPTVPGPLDDLVAHATARDPRERPADGAALLDAVRAARSRVPRHEATRVLTEPTRPMPPLPPRTAGETTPSQQATHWPRSNQHATRRQDAARDDQRRADQPRGATDTGRRWGRRALVVAALVLALAAGGGAAWWQIAGPGATTTVPGVGRVSLADARSRLDRAYLQSTTSEAFSEEIPAGAVIGQAPPAGTTLHRGETVALTVSKGPERYVVPQLAGATVTEATARLAGAHLRVGTRREVYDEKVPQGQVVATDPEAGRPLKRDAAVTLTVSKGREPIAVPSLVGLTSDDAMAAVKEAGLSLAVATDRVYSSSVPEGQVAGQDPGRRATVHRGDTVTVTLSKGPELVTVPNVVGRPRREAKQALEALGLTVRFDLYFGGIFDTVRLQSTPAGRQVAKGSVITLTIV